MQKVVFFTNSRGFAVSNQMIGLLGLKTNLAKSYKRLPENNVTVSKKYFLLFKAFSILLAFCISYQRCLEDIVTFRHDRWIRNVKSVCADLILRCFEKRHNHETEDLQDTRVSIPVVKPL